jgi:shikimate kinase
MQIPPYPSESAGHEKEIPSLVIYGMMGSGKTATAIRMSKALGMTMTDTDALIEEHTGMLCGEIVANPDMDFPAIQEEVILAYQPTSPEIIATGGSVAMYPNLVSHLGKFGIGVHLNTDAHETEARLSAERIAAMNRKPGQENFTFVELAAARDGSYLHAARGIKLDVPLGQSLDEITERMLELRESLINTPRASVVLTTGVTDGVLLDHTTITGPTALKDGYARFKDILEKDADWLVQGHVSRDWWHNLFVEMTVRSDYGAVRDSKLLNIS